ncbi:MAG TPA: alanine--tRNA ligase [Candidatus Taylorbacteria bacterium]|nr:MAG: Alanine-tRNA ligase [Parcubacteria group bacterium GW2011_GWA2_47_64]KKU96053.1 MAG: Alanine-tRNA ligase [Parcubacteria group bacterium GW2011_GWC2_48_17]HBV00827.1 alanine--tRNA ligase [Candidatus Taylorbacteria bacterium]
MTISEIRRRFLDFFKSRGHAIIPSASLVPENDPSVLFTTAGMQPLVPYLLGQPHPSGKRLVNIQKCVRTGDIDEVGDNTHLTFFEMLGNWSLGDYFKEDAIKWSYELLTSKKEGFALDPERLYITVFEGNSDAPRDEESASIWKVVGIPQNRIYYMPASKNWWEAGQSGPCGPDTEMYYDITEKGLGDLAHAEFLKADEMQEVVEIWNDVFMEYLKKDGKVVGKLPQKNVDTGAGLERICAVLQKKKSVFDTDAFKPIMDFASTIASDTRARHVIADHMRAAIFLIGDGVLPSNTGQGYILRRLIRRAVFSADENKVSSREITALVEIVSGIYGDVYDNIRRRQKEIAEVISNESEQFQKTLHQGLKEFEKLETVSGKDAFTLFSTYGFPFEMTAELAEKRGRNVDRAEFEGEMRRHQELSRAGALKRFKGGLADTSEMSVKYHTATHLLHQALRDILGKEVQQKGSNITPERLRFDFAFQRKMTDDEKKKVEDVVNEKIKADLAVHKTTLPLEAAKKSGALHFFDEKYPDEVLIHYIGNSLETAYSKEFCGGPHVQSIGTLGTFRILKEEAVSAGVRRIKAILQ